MSNNVRFGLIACAISLVVTALWAATIGACYPLVTMITGGIAGYLAARKEMPAAKRHRGRSGAILGILVGGFSVIGDFIGLIAGYAIRSETYDLQAAISTGLDEQGVIVPLCFGLISIALAGMAGFAGDSVGTLQSAPVTQDNLSSERDADMTRRKGCIFGILGSTVAMIIAFFLAYAGLTQLFKSAEQQCFGINDPLAVLDCLSRLQSSTFIAGMIAAVLVGGVTFYLILRYFNKRAKSEEAEMLIKP